MIRTAKLTLTTSGTNGSATASGQTGVVSGRIMAIHLDYTNEPNTTDVTIATKNAPVQSILTITSANTDGWFYPRVLLDGLTGADLTAVYDTIPVDDHIGVSVAEGDNAGTIAVTILYEQ